MQTAVAGVSANIIVPCSLGRQPQDEPPCWYINGSVYELFSIPHTFLPGATPAVHLIPVVDSYSALTIPEVTTGLDDTTFQCAVFNQDGIVLGIVNTLNVVTLSGLQGGFVSWLSDRTTAIYVYHPAVVIIISSITSSKFNGKI